MKPVGVKDLSVNIPEGLTNEEYLESAAQSQKRITQIIAADGVITPGLERLIDVHRKEEATALHLAEIALKTGK